ncbi:hypothetical protein MTO96_026481 [Rhipicephalus appendiculatus]
MNRHSKKKKTKDSSGSLLCMVQYCLQKGSNFASCSFSRLGINSPNQAVLPTLLRIIRKKLGKRFKETRDLVMFIVVVMFALIYLIISSKLILDRIELPDDEKGSIQNGTTTESSVLVITYPPECIEPNHTIICLPEAQYMDQHLTKDTLCTDPYGSICNQNYFHSGENRLVSLWPYRYANLQFIYEAFKSIIKWDFKNFKAPVKPAEETAMYKALYFLKNCTNSHLKRALARVGLPSCPYSAQHNETYEDVAIVLGNVMRSLDLQIFFVVDFVQHTSSKADAPFGKKVVIRKLPHLGATKERRRDNTATEKCEYAYCLLKTPQLTPPHERLYNYITKEFYTFIYNLSRQRVKWTEEEVKKSPTLAELQDATAVRNEDGNVMYQGFNWTLFLNTLLANTTFTFTDSTTVFVEDYAIVTNVMKLVQKASRNIVLNYILLEVWSFIAPLLPAKYLHNVRYLPDTDFVSLGSSTIPTNCFKLAEIFCPEGMASVLRQTMLRFPDRQAASKWETEITDIYRQYFSYFFDGFADKIVPADASMIPDKNKYFADQKAILSKQKIRIAILEQFDKDIKDLKCDAVIRAAEGDATEDIGLYNFVYTVRARKIKQWTARFTKVSTDYDKPEPSNFAYAIHFVKDYMFIPLVYVAGILRHPLFKETYVTMSLVDALKAIMTHLFEQRANDKARIRRGVPILQYVMQNATALEEQLRVHLNVTDAETVQGKTTDLRWIWADMLATRWFFDILGMQLGSIKKERIDRGLPKDYVYRMHYILFAEAACRRYQEEPFWWTNIFDYGIPPAAEVNLALLGYSQYNQSFHCGIDY